MIEKFENHPNKESFLRDFKQTKEINEFSKESQDLIADMNNTEIFEFCETYSKQQCPDCNQYWEASIVCCTCGRCLRRSRNGKEVDKSNNDVVSIPGYVIWKNNKRGAMDLLNDKECITRKEKCCIKRVKRNMRTLIRITRLTNKQIKSRKRATSQKRRESDDKNVVAIVKSVLQLFITRFRCTRFSR